MFRHEQQNRNVLISTVVYIYQAPVKNHKRRNETNLKTDRCDIGEQFVPCWRQKLEMRARTSDETEREPSRDRRFS